jgi:hypothetical protein
MKARLLVALLFAAVAIAAPAARPCPVCAGDGIGPDALVKGAGEMPDDVLAVTVEIVGIAVAVCAAILTVVIPLLDPRSPGIGSWTDRDGHADVAGGSVGDPYHRGAGGDHDALGGCQGRQLDNTGRSTMGKRVASRWAMLLGDPGLQRDVVRVSRVVACAVMICQWAQPALAAPAAGSDDPGGKLADLAAAAVQGLIVLSGLVLMIAFAAGGFQGILGRVAGLPYAQANAWMMILDVVVLFVLVAFSKPLAEAIVNAVTGE